MMIKNFTLFVLLIFGFDNSNASQINVFVRSDNKNPVNYELIDSTVNVSSLRGLAENDTFNYYPLADDDKIAKPGKEYIVKFKILNKTNRNLYLSGFRTYDFEFVIGNSKDGFETFSEKKNAYFLDKKYISNYSIVPIQCSNDTIYVYAKLKSSVAFGLGFYLVADSFLNSNTIFNTAYYVFILTIMCSIFIFSLVLSIRLKETLYYFYSLYVLSLIIYAITTWGFFPFFNILTKGDFYAESIPFGFATIFLLLYSTRLLNTAIYYKNLHKLILLAVSVRLLFLILSFYGGFTILNNTYFDCLLMVPSFWAGIQSFRSGNRYVKYFILSYLILYLGVIYHSTLEQTIWLLTLYYRSMLSFYFLDWTIILFICILFDLLFYSIGIVSRMRSLRQQVVIEKTKTIAFQEKIIEQNKLNILEKELQNQELERIVMERTLELKQSNELLRIHSIEIEQINEILEIDNIKLQQDLEVLKNARLLGKNLSYIEFGQTFPSDESALEFLSHLKWQEGYSCIKCGYKKYNQGQLYCSRKCKSCGYDESATFGTLFENQKFSPLKALYMAYAFHTFKGKLHLSNLSEEISLRLGTCHSFIKKVKEHIATHDKAKNETSDWTTILLEK